MPRKSYIAKDGETGELDEAFFKEARRGRPPLPDSVKKKRITALLDPDVIAALKQEGKGWQTRMNDLLRDALALGERPKT